MVPEWAAPWLLLSGCAAGVVLFLVSNPLEGAMWRGTRLFFAGWGFAGVLLLGGAWDEWERRRETAGSSAEHHSAGGAEAGWPELGSAAKPELADAAMGLRSVFWMVLPWKPALAAGPLLASLALWIRRDLWNVGGATFRRGMWAFASWTALSWAVWAEHLARWTGWTGSWWGNQTLSHVLGLMVGWGFAAVVQGGLFLAVGRRALGRTEGWDLAGLLAMTLLSARRTIPLGGIVALGWWAGELAAGRGWPERVLLVWGVVSMALLAGAPAAAAMRGGSWAAILRQTLARILLRPREHFWLLAGTLLVFYFSGVTDRWVCAAWEPGSAFLYAWFGLHFLGRSLITLWLIFVFATRYAESMAEAGRRRPRDRRSAPAHA
ncbi:MAG TPA: hypothetical protein VMN36_15315 [Verrucomicrobiales bacterium]|nr:hypothetical protein [Verrucomicrobiales bacterium]